MNITKYLAAGLCMASLASPAMADKYFAVTPSGASETLFPDKPQIVAGKLSGRCMDVKWTVVTSTPNEVTCEAAHTLPSGGAASRYLGR